MECTGVRNRLFQKIDGELATLENAELDAHLAECSSCTREYGLLSLPHRIAREIPPPEASPFFYQKLRMRIDSEAPGIAGRQTYFGLATRMIPTLAGITLALLTVFAYFELHGPEADIYRDYDRAFVSEDQTHRTLVAVHGDITDEGVLRAIAER